MESNAVRRVYRGSQLRVRDVVVYPELFVRCELSQKMFKRYTGAHILRQLTVKDHFVKLVKDFLMHIYQ